MAMKLLLLTPLLLALGLPQALASYNITEDIRLDTLGLLRKYGYPGEEHVVTSEDGYILTLHRVPYSPLNPPREGEQPRPAVLLQHGLLCSSADWVVMGPGRGFAYILADAGYDVWMGNFRGNTYSRKHVSMHPDKLFTKFWKFDWHEMAIYDLPATIDYVIAQTCQEKIFYAGHSMGTTTFFVMASVKPEYNAKIRAMFALAPIAYTGHMTSPFFQLFSLGNKPLEWVMKLIGINEFMPNNELMQLVGQVLCRDHSLFQIVCDNVLFLIAGYDSSELNSTMLPVILGHTPAGASTRTLLHYAQEIVSKKFRWWDYGTLSNIGHYGGISPPKYDARKITAPVALHYSGNDWLSAVRDVDKLYGELGNAIGKFRVTHSAFNHLDYLWAIHAKELVYDKVISLMGRY